MKKLTGIVASAILASSVSTLVLAEDFEAELKARQGFFQIVKKNVGIIAAMVKGKAEYNAEDAQTAADNLKYLGQLDISNLWPAGSDNGAISGTKAKPEIWSDPKGFTGKHQDWKVAVETLAENASGGLDSLKSNFGPVGKACKACHQEYKTK